MNTLTKKLDPHWISSLKKIQKGKRFSMEWYINHPITKELLNSCVLHGKVLDIGCGTGQRASIAHKKSKCNIIGIDGSKYAINYASEKFRNPTLNFVNNNVLTMPFLNNFFDNAYMLGVIEHIPNTNLLISEIKRIIIPGGNLFISVTENDYHSSPDHVHIFSKELMHKTFQKYKIINSFVKDHIIFMTIQF